MATLRVVMALMIVAHHLTLHYGVSAFKPFVHVGAPVVSMFFFISGYGLCKSYQVKGDKYLDSFFRHRIWKVILPLFLALALYYLLLRDPSRNFWGEWKQLLTDGVTVLPYSWFAVSIIAFYLVYYFSYRFLPGNGKWAGVLIGTISMMMFAIAMGYDRCWWISSMAFPTGVIYAYCENALYERIDRYPSLYWGTLFLLLAVFFAAYLTGQEYIWTICYVCIPLFLALVAGYLPLEKFNVKVVSFLATITYEVYLCQGIAMELLRGRIFIQNELLFVILVYVLTIVLASAVHFIAECTFSTT